MMLPTLWAAIAGLWSTVIGRWLNVAAVAGLVALAALAGASWLRAKVAESKVAALMIDQERLQGAIDALNIVIAGKDDAIAELEATRLEAERQAAELNTMIEEVRHAPPRDNAPIAPVLERTLRRLDAGGVREQRR